MKDYRPLLSDVVGFLEELTDKIRDWGGGPMIDDNISLTKEEVDTLIGKLEEFFAELDDELG